MRIDNNCLVSLEFTLTTDSGQVLDRSPEGKPLDYVHGAAGILPELERHLTGKAVGDRFDVTLPPERGFGDRQPALVEVLPRVMFGTPELAVGVAVSRADPNGSVQNYLVTAIDADSVTVDGNHPLAGLTLRFQGTVLGIRAGTAETAAQ